MTRQYLIPGWGYINETTNTQYLIPGWGYINETQSTNVTGTMAPTEANDVMAASAAELFSGSFSSIEGNDLTTTASTLAIDGFVGFQTTSSSATSVTLNLTTTQSNDVIIVAFAPNSATSIISIMDTAGLTWHSRAVSTGGQVIIEWEAIAPSPLTADTITINFNGSLSFCTGCIFAISGANIIAPFDTNASIPAITPFTGATVDISTTASNTMILGLYRQSSTASPTAGAGFTTIYAPTGGYYIAQYKIVSTPQTNLPIGQQGATTNADNNGGIGDAIVAGSTTGGIGSITFSGTSAIQEANDFMSAVGNNGQSGGSGIPYFHRKRGQPGQIIRGAGGMGGQVVYDGSS